MLTDHTVHLFAGPGTSPGHPLTAPLRPWDLSPQPREQRGRKARPRADLPPQRTFQNLPHVRVVILRQDQDHLWQQQKETGRGQRSRGSGRGASCPPPTLSGHGVSGASVVRALCSQHPRGTRPPCARALRHRAEASLLLARTALGTSRSLRSTRQLPLGGNSNPALEAPAVVNGPAQAAVPGEQRTQRARLLRRGTGGPWTAPRPPRAAADGRAGDSGRGAGRRPRPLEPSADSHGAHTVFIAVKPFTPHTGPSLTEAMSPQKTPLLTSQKYACYEHPKVLPDRCMKDNKEVRIWGPRARAPPGDRTSPRLSWYLRSPGAHCQALAAAPNTPLPWEPREGKRERPRSPAQPPAWLIGGHRTGHRAAWPVHSRRGCRRRGPAGPSLAGDESREDEGGR